MSDTKPADLGNVTPEQLQNIGGGACTPADIVSIVGNLTTAYESLVDFTSHVIGRVNNAL